MSNILLSFSDIICLTKTWLCAGISSLNYFPYNYAVYRKDRGYDTTEMTLGGSVLLAVKCLVQSHQRKDLESFSECTWVEIPMRDGFNFLIRNYNFPHLFLMRQSS